MSKSRKDSADNARRGVDKPHQPYQVDDYAHGKKTGVNIQPTDRKSDGFESFRDVLTQADVVTPPHARNKRKIKNSPSSVAEYDEDGEMSMDLDDPATPRAYFNNAPRPTLPTSANKPRASSQSGNRSSYVDYDHVPSPRLSSFSRQQMSQTNGRTAARQTSNLSQTIPSSPEEDIIADHASEDGHNVFENFDTNEQQLSPPGHQSFTEMDQDEEEKVLSAKDPVISSPLRVKDKGKRKEIRTEEEQIEDEIAQGLADITNGIHGTDDESEKPKPKRRRERDEQATKQTKPQSKRKKVQLELPESTNMAEGVRRSMRTRYKPLEWWRCEKVVYGRRDSGTSMVPVIKDIIRLPKDIPEPLARRHGRKPRSQSKTLPDEENNIVVANPEEGWDDQTDPHGIVLDYVTSSEVRRRVAFTAKMVIPKSAANNDFAFQKIFGDGEFIAAGQLIIPVGGKKPSKGTKDNTYVFYLIEGAINLRIHRTSFILATGGMFLIPRGNNYYMENVSERPAKLFFAQARKVSADDEAPPEIQSSSKIRKSVEPSRMQSNGSRLPSNSNRSSSITGPSSPEKSGKPRTKRAISN